MPKHKFSSAVPNFYLLSGTLKPIQNIILKMNSQKVKLVIIGDGAVGKTCIIVSFLENRFPYQYAPTSGYDSSIAHMKIDGKVISLQLWDTAGQQQYARIRPLVYPNTDIFVIAFSVTDPTSFIQARKKWYVQIKQLSLKKSPIIFLGNKIDMREQYRTKYGSNKRNSPIEYEVAKKILKEELNCQYFQCSALTQQGIQEVFTSAAKMVLQKRQKDNAITQQKSCLCSIM